MIWFWTNNSCRENFRGKDFKVIIIIIIQFMESLEAFMQPMVGSPLVYSMNTRVIEAYDIEHD